MNWLLNNNDSCGFAHCSTAVTKVFLFIRLKTAKISKHRLFDEDVVLRMLIQSKVLNVSPHVHNSNIDAMAKPDIRMLIHDR